MAHKTKFKLNNNKINLNCKKKSNVKLFIQFQENGLQNGIQSFGSIFKNIIR